MYLKKIQPDEAPLTISEAMPHPVFLEHAKAAHHLISRCSLRAVDNCATSVKMWPHLMDADTWTDLLQMQGAISERLQQQNQQWVKGVAAIVRDYARIKKANTMSKLFEQQFNVIGQWGQLLSNQTTSLVELQQNIETNFGYWLHQKFDS